MRRSATQQEVVVWEWLRGRRMLGLKFRRQQPVAGFILDFYCASERLALELDGGIHDKDSRRHWDAERDGALTRLGIQVVRIRNEEASRETIERRLRTFMTQTLVSSPSPAGRGVGVRVQSRRSRG